MLLLLLIRTCWQAFVVSHIYMMYGCHSIKLQYESKTQNVWKTYTPLSLSYTNTKCSRNAGLAFRSCQAVDAMQGETQAELVSPSQRLPLCLGHRLLQLPLGSWRPQESLLVCIELRSQHLLHIQTNVFTRPPKAKDRVLLLLLTYTHLYRCFHTPCWHTVHSYVCAHGCDEEQSFGGRINEAANKTTPSHKLPQFSVSFPFLFITSSFFYFFFCWMPHIQQVHKSIFYMSK